MKQRANEGIDCSVVRFRTQSSVRRSGRDRTVGRLRKGCRSPFRLQPIQVQTLPEKSRTSLEGPFGEVLRATGPMAKANPFRFSTKYQDDALGWKVSQRRLESCRWEP